MFRNRNLLNTRSSDEASLSLFFPKYCKVGKCREKIQKFPLSQEPKSYIFAVQFLAFLVNSKCCGKRNCRTLRVGPSWRERHGVFYAANVHAKAGVPVPSSVNRLSASEEHTNCYSSAWSVSPFRYSCSNSRSCAQNLRSSEFQRRKFLWRGSEK